MRICRKNLLSVFVLFFVLAFLAGCATRAAHFRLDPSLAGQVRNISGFQYVPLDKLCDAYGLECVVDTVVMTAMISKGSDTIILRSGSDTILVNGSIRKIARPVVMSDGAIFVPLLFVKSDISRIVGRLPVSGPPTLPPPIIPTKQFTIRTIVIDTGHGGKDVGAVGRAFGTKEKDLAMKLAKRVKDILEAGGMRVIMTRSDDTFISLERRSAIANKSGADLFVSIHINASRSRALKGFECYYLSSATDDNARALQAFEDSSLKLGGDAAAEHSSQLDKTLWDMALTENRMESGELAGYICESVERSKLGIRNRGVRTARFFVLKNTNIPAVLVEAGYLSNRAEESALRDEGTINKLAEAIAGGIMRYKARYEDTEAFTNVR